MNDIAGLGVWIGVLLVVLSVGFYGIVLLRKWLFVDKNDTDEVTDAVYTTAQLESMKKAGLVDEKQYERLKHEVYKASMRRAAREKARKESSKKRSLFG